MIADAPRTFPSTLPSTLPFSSPSDFPSFECIDLPSYYPSLITSRTKSAPPFSDQILIPSSHPITSPSIDPSGTTSVDTSSTASLLHSKRSSKEPSTGPKSEPSYSPSNKPSRPQQLEPSKEKSEGPSSVPLLLSSSFLSFYPSTYDIYFMSYSPNISSKPSTCKLYGNRASPTMLASNEDCGKCLIMLKKIVVWVLHGVLKNIVNGAATKLIKIILGNLVVRNLKTPLLFRHLLRV